MVEAKETPIKKWLNSKGFSQSWLARRLGVKRQAVSNWVHGKRIPEDGIAFALVEIADGDLKLEDIKDPSGAIRAKAALMAPAHRAA